MPKPLPTDGVQAKDGDTIVLLFGKYNPAHMGYFRALEALVRRPVAEIWVTPLYSLFPIEHVQNMCTILSTEASVATKRQVGCCLAGLKGFLRIDEFLPWCRSKYPGLRFVSAKLCGFQRSDKADIEVRFAGQELSSGKDDVYVPQFLPVPQDLAERIGSGSDESRNFLAPIWEYVQKHRLYRGSHGQV